MSSSINQTELQKLIDGELDLAATRQLLKSAETNSAQWRQIATAFAEDRLWQKSFQQLESEVEPSNIDPPKPETAANAIPNRIFTSTRLPSRLALAAGLLLAAGVGFFAGSDRSFKSDVDRSNMLAAADDKQDTATDALTASDAITLADLSPDYELELTDAMGVGKSSVPLYSARRLNQLSPSQRGAFVASGPSDQDLQRWQQSGYQYRQKIDYFSGRLKDGRTFVVPVQTINVSTGQ